MSEVDIEPLGRVIDRLGEALAVFRSDPENDYLRDAVVKRFELTFELAKNTLRRFLMIYSNHLRSGLDETFASLIRTANQDGLLRSDWERWKFFRDTRNRTAHTYNEREAVEVVAAIPDFLEEVRFMYAQMRRVEQEV